MNQTSLSLPQQEDRLREAVACHQAGDLVQAEAGYFAVLQNNPQHAEANHNAGMLALQLGQAEAGLPYFLAALEAEPACSRYWLSYISTLIEAGQFDDAKSMLALAKSQGLDGDEVDELAARLAPSSSMQPERCEVDALLAQFGAGLYNEALSSASVMTLKYPVYEFGWKAQGAIYKQLGQFEEAMQSMSRAAELSPLDVETQYNLGVILQDLGRLNEAETAYRRALALDPAYVDAMGNLGVVLQKLGSLDEAESSYRRAIALRPEYTDASSNLATLLCELGRLDEAKACYLNLLQRVGENAALYCSLGTVQVELGDGAGAEASFRHALLISPDYAKAHYELANCMRGQGLLAEAEQHYRNAIAIAPDLVEAHYNLGNALRESGRMTDAEASYRAAIAIDPALMLAHYNLGNVLLERGALTEAEASFRQAIALREDYAEAHANLGLALKEMGKTQEAEVCMRTALKYQPDFAEAQNNLGGLLIKYGRYEEALSCFREALALKPDFALAHSNLIFVMDLMLGETIESLQAERRRWDAQHAASLYPANPHDNDPDPLRPLRIGYLSGDFREHSAPKVFGGMLTRYDRTQFEVFAYSNFKGGDDRVTELFKQNVSGWRNISGLSDEAAADLIRADRIDILVDISGHSAGNRLLVFARKPAPLQITAWGYASGTGMRAMDVFFADPVVAPEAERVHFAEKIVDLPCVVGTFTLDEYPEISSLPALADGVVTFGSFNRLTKLSEESYRIWCELLKAMPSSRLLMKAPELTLPEIRTLTLARFVDAGIDASRIVLLGKTSWREHMEAHHRVDIALDPFPHGGGVTTQESLMMGVPVVTLSWPTMAGRVTASIMTCLGLQDWIANSAEEYVKLAVKKTEDLKALAHLRGKLRNIYTSSVMGDPDAYARAVEHEYRALWKTWCSKVSGGS